MTEFWIYDLSVLWTCPYWIPESWMTSTEKLNCLSRWVFIISILLLIAGWKYWIWVLVIGLFLLITAYFLQPRRPRENYQCPIYRPRYQRYGRKKN